MQFNETLFNEIFSNILVFFYIHFLSESHTNKHTFEKAWFGLVQWCLGKGQLISEWLFGVFNFPKHQRKILMNFCPKI